MSISKNYFLTFSPDSYRERRIEVVKGKFFLDVYK